MELIFHADHPYHNHNNDECYDNDCNLKKVTRIVQRTCRGAPELVSNFGKRYPGKKYSCILQEVRNFKCLLSALGSLSVY